jgi:hypothetical protein
MSKPRNLWQEWWGHFIKYYEDTRKTYEDIKAKGYDETFPFFLESVRRDWFKEMRK